MRGFLTAFVVLSAALLAGAWYADSQTSTLGFQADRGVEKLGEHFDGALVLVGVSVATVVIIAIILWMAQDGFTRNESIMLGVIVALTVAVVWLADGWPTVWDGLWSRATLTLVLIIGAAAAGAAVITSAHNNTPKTQVKKGGDGHA